MLNNHIGLAKVGLPSLESPVIESNTSTSYNHVGIMRLGTSQSIGSSGTFVIKGKIIQTSKSVFGAIGTMSMPVTNLCRVVGSSFVPLFKSNFVASGNLALKVMNTLDIKGIIRQSNESVFNVKSTLAQGQNSNFKVKSILKANFSSVFRVKSIVTQSSGKLINVKGTLRQSSTSNLGVKGTIQQSLNSLFTSKGVSAVRSNVKLISKGILQQGYNSLISIKGGLANTKWTSFFEAKGSINVAAFVQSVPKRVQEFVTNKNWFK